MFLVFRIKNSLTYKQPPNGVVGVEGLEPSRMYIQQILSLARLPITTHPHITDFYRSRRAHTSTLNRSSAERKSIYIPPIQVERRKLNSSLLARRICLWYCSPGHDPWADVCCISLIPGTTSLVATTWTRQLAFLLAAFYLLDSRFIK